MQMKKTDVIAICNQKGGVGKTASAVSMGIALTQEGKKVLLVDFDPQGDATYSLGWKNYDKLEDTIASLMKKIIQDEEISDGEAVLTHKEGVELIPANEKLADMEVALVNVISRELVLKDYLEEVKDKYDYVLIDCPPSLGMLTINALAAADSVLIPVQANPLPAKDMTQLIKTINKVKRGINPGLRIDGIVITLVDARTNLAKDVTSQLKENYGSAIKIYDNQIPLAVKAAEVTARGKSIFAYDEKGTVAKAYKALAKEVIRNGEKRKERIRSAEAR